jgi:glycosyltransferase 2 family protein
MTRAVLCQVPVVAWIAEGLTAENGKRPMKTKLIAGLLLSLVLVWLSLRGIDMEEVYKGFRKVHIPFIIYSTAVMFLIQILRAVRWGLILKPLDDISKFTIFSITNVGSLAIVAIPARLGELVKPYLIAKKSRLSIGSALGTVFIDRMLDIAVILIVAVTVFFVTPLPSLLFRFGFILLLLLIAILALGAFTLFWKEKAKQILAPLIKIFPTRYVTLMNKLTNQFIEGFSILNNPAPLIAIMFISLSIWLANVLAIYFFFMAFNLNLPLTAAFTIMIILIAGIAIPSAPGFIGNWHYACVLGLGFFGVAKTSALSFAILYHAVSVGLILTLGLVSLPFNSFSIADLRHREHP